MKKMSDRYVSREKYERAKDAANAWHEKLQEANEQLETYEAENAELASTNAKLARSQKDLQEQIVKLKSEVSRWKKLSEELPDSDLVEELEAESKQHRREIRKLKKENHDIEDKYKDRIAKLERERLLSDGRIQQLEEARKDLRERYNDLKQDYREQQRWARGTMSVAEK